jgi:hypothetical protein
MEDKTVSNRFAIWSALPGGAYTPHFAETFEQAQQVWREQLGTGASDVMVTEVVAMVVLDGRSIQARLLALAERVERLRVKMRNHGIAVRTLAKKVGWAESSIEDLLDGRVMDERKLERLEFAVDELAP